jgi:transmembrane sensor
MVFDSEDAAALWAIRRDAAELDAAARSELEAWLAVDERHAGALLRAEAALAYLDRGRALGGKIADEEQRQSEPPAAAHGVRPRFGRRGILAASAGAIAAAFTGYTILGRQPDTITTALGEVRRVPLADGSIASVNTASRIAFAVRDARREVSLEDGEAWFQVAHDEKKPFVVAAGQVRVQAIGTAFSMRRHQEGVDVLVTEGVVEAWIVGHETRRTRIAAGSMSFVANKSPDIVTSDASREIERTLAWRNGELVLNGQTLAYAAAELNRYNRRKLVIEDDRLGRETLVGYFQTEQPEKFARAAAAMLGADIEIEGDTIRLSPR